MTPRTVALAAAALVVYVAMWAGFLSDWAWLHTVDHGILAHLHAFGVQHPHWVAGWNWFCNIFSPAAIRIVSLIFIGWLIVRRRYRPAVFLLLTVEGSAILTEVAKGLANRPRPESALLYATSTSFPSGHALGLMVCVLALLTVILPMVDQRWHTPLKVGGAALVLAIGVGRVVLNVHYPSDVLAGWALGYLWFLACTPVMRGTAH